VRFSPFPGGEGDKTTSMDYFDLQVNGFAGVDFNQDDLTAEQLHVLCDALRRDNVGGILATIITEDVATMCRRIERVAVLREKDELARNIIAGIHIEGPFISPVKGYHGAHPVDAVREANLDEAKRLLEAGRGLVRLFTLAPEQDPRLSVTRWLRDQGVVVSAGHTDASRDQLKAAADAGLSMFTHLGNGCPMLMHRHDNIIQRALSLSERLWICFIADGVHVPFMALRNYLRMIGSLDRVNVVTDAMTAAGLGPGRFKIARWDVVVGDDMVARSPDGSHFLGAAITMPQTHANLREHLGLSDAECLRLLRDNPRRAVEKPEVRSQ
jgi:N-acetylglucosamine-6-phosphate deacetylase